MILGLRYIHGILRGTRRPPRTRAHLVAEHVIQHAEVDAPLEALGEVLPPGCGPQSPAAPAPQERQRQRQLQDTLVEHGDQVVLLAHDAASSN